MMGLLRTMRRAPARLLASVVAIALAVGAIGVFAVPGVASGTLRDLAADDRLAERPYMVGGEYGLVDMAVWGWARLIPFILGEDVPGQMPNLKRLMDEINARPAAQRAEAIKERFTFKTEMDEAARRNMFPSAFAS